MVTQAKATELMDKLSLVQLYQENYGGKYLTKLTWPFFSFIELQSCETVICSSAGDGFPDAVIRETYNRCHFESLKLLESYQLPKKAHEDTQNSKKGNSYDISYVQVASDENVQSEERIRCCCHDLTVHERIPHSEIVPVRSQ